MTTTLANVQTDMAKVQAIGSAAAAAASLVPSLITQAQSLFPQGTPGATKLAFVKNWVENILQVMGHELPVVEAIWAQTEPIVATIVTIYTHNGLFASLLAATVVTQPAASSGGAVGAR